ncbi:MAG: sodium transporter, partial [Bacteroidota bacterium]
LAIFSNRVNAFGMKISILLSVSLNLLFSETMQKIFGFELGFHVFWIWLNFTGFGMTIVFAYLFSLMGGKVPDQGEKNPISFQIRRSDWLSKEPLMLLLFFGFILWVSYNIPFFIKLIFN